jgi:hypothetical protein
MQMASGVQLLEGVQSNLIFSRAYPHEAKLHSPFTVAGRTFNHAGGQQQDFT